MSSEQLFRAEALKHQGVKLDGNVVIAQSVKASTMVAILLLTVIILLFFLGQASFNRKETVTGFLKPDQGMARVASQRSGTVIKLFVKDGDAVLPGEKLALISSDEHLAHGATISSQLLASITQQRLTLQQRLDEYQHFYQQQRETYHKRISNLDAQLAEIRSQQNLMQQRQVLYQQRFDDFKALRLKGHISAAELNSQHELVLSLQQQERELQISYQDQQGRLIDLRAKLEALPTEHEQQKAQLNNELARLSQQQSELAARGEVLLTAPLAGRVTNLVTDIGSMVTAGKTLLTILPADSNLYAVLLVPTRAFGFIETGQQARLRYNAFPYQRFGLYSGKVTQQSKAILLPNEVDMPVPLTEPVYQVSVKLDSQTVNAYGEQVELQAGMLLNADIVLEQRSLLSWLFEPILSLRGQL